MIFALRGEIRQTGVRVPRPNRARRRTNDPVESETMPGPALFPNSVKTRTLVTGLSHTTASDRDVDLQGFQVFNELLCDNVTSCFYILLRRYTCSTTAILFLFYFYIFYIDFLSQLSHYSEEEEKAFTNQHFGVVTKSVTRL